MDFPPGARLESGQITGTGERVSTNDSGAGSDRAGPEVHYNRGMAALKAGRPARAMGHFEDAIHADRLRGNLRPRVLFLSYYGLARALDGRADHEAVQACELSVARDSFDPRLHLNLGRVYLMAGKSTRALAVLERGLGLHPGDRPLASLLDKVDRRSPPTLTRLGRDHLLNRAIGRLRKSLGAAPRGQWDFRRAYLRSRSLQ
jgi:tetratricopeptide (TPR) repeat protein